MASRPGLWFAISSIIALLWFVPRAYFWLPRVYAELPSYTELRGHAEPGGQIGGHAEPSGRGYAEPSGHVEPSGRAEPSGHAEPTTPAEICRSTTGIRLDPHAFAIQSLVDGKNKTMGGDEYYVWAGKKEAPSSIALVQDHGNGTYSLTWQGLPDSPAGPLDVSDVTVLLQYSCGVGQLGQPSKSSWPNGRAPLVPWTFPGHYGFHQQPEAAVSYGVSEPIYLDNFAVAVAVGDSLLQQLLLCRGGGPFSTIYNIYRAPRFYFLKVQATLLPTTVEVHYLERLRKFFRDHHERPALVVLNAGVWNLLEPVPDQDFRQLKEAIRTLIATVLKEFSGVTIVWKGMTAVHIHVVNCQLARNQKLCVERVKYMSSSRALLLTETEISAIENYTRAKQVQYLPMYNYTYVSAHMTRPNDGSHYNDELNACFWSEFFRYHGPPPENTSKICPSCSYSPPK